MGSRPDLAFHRSRVALLGFLIGISCVGCRVYKQELLGVTLETPDGSVIAPKVDSGVGQVEAAAQLDPLSCTWGECWWSTVGPDACRSAGMPQTSDRPPSDTDVATAISDIYLGFTHVRVGSTNRDGQKTEDAWEDFGFDLDGLCTSSVTCPGAVGVSCKTAGPAVPFDGQLCRDNTFARLQPVLGAVPELGEKFGLSEEVFNCALWRGSYNTIIRLSSYNGAPNDSHVRVDFYASNGLQDPFSWNCPSDDYRSRYPRWRSSRKWGVDESYLTGPIVSEGTLPDSMFADANAYVKNGYLVAQVPDGTEQGFLGDGDPYRGFVYKARHAVFVGHVFKQQDATWAIRDGMMAGRITKDDLLQAFREVGFCGDAEQQSFYTNMLTYIEEDADVLASGGVDPGKYCDAMSYAVGFEAGQVLPGSAVKVPPRIECCPPGKTLEECSAKCGDGELNGAEKCDTAIAAGQPGACPTVCPVAAECTEHVLTGSECAAECVAKPITTVGAKDGCCPLGANAITDNDCMASCGNGVIEAGETCDPAGSCMPCPATNGCLTTSTTGSAETCNLRCEYDVISQCLTGDSCCPANCNNSSDQDCSTTCNDGKIDNGETCEAGTEAPCAASCDDRQPCTLDQTIGSAANCNVVCTHAQITQPRGGDGCCPDGATANSDNDCRTRCGNRVVENGEQCDDGNEAAGDGCAACKSEDQQQVCLATMGRDDDCARCSCSKCQSQSLGCYGTGSRDDVEACDELVQCQRRTSCGNPSCFCGDVSLFACLAGGSDGPCKQQILGAAKTSALSEISARSTDSAYPLGRANALDGCSRMNCAAECAQ